ncbi:MAG: family 10 glycosylhydrolase [Acaryochloridaceae cyanobacterium RU_4_10]|nr:family 10 glycosylhydrolase [Acaryochloridaceae cyanobacterium RU_4_10]
MAGLESKKIALGLSTVFAASGLAIVPQSISRSTQNTGQELRGVWLTNVDSDVLFSQDRLNTGIKRLAKLNFNTIYPTVWNAGHTLYPSQVAFQSTGETHRLYPDSKATGQRDSREAAQRDRDMLKELIAVARRENLHVVPWFEFGFMAPANSELVKRHPDWVTQRRDGSKIVMKEGIHPRVWLNPFHPGVQKFLIDLASEVVTRYDVDGIQFDDHFGLPAPWGYDPYTVNLYRKEHKWKRPSRIATNPEWVRWRASKLTAFMGKLHQAVKAKNPKVTISLSPNPARFAYKWYMQDWVTWEKRGYIDELVLQVYRTDRKGFLSELQRPEVIRAKRRIPVSIGILSGLKNQNVSMNWIQKQVKWTRSHKFAGVSFFFYETLLTSKTESLAQRSTGLQTLFPNPIRRSSISEGWKFSKK